MPALLRPGVAAPVSGMRIPQYLTGAQRALQADAQNPGAFQRVAQMPYGPVRVVPQRFIGTGAQRARAIEGLFNRPTIPTLNMYPGGGSLYGRTAYRVPFQTAAPFGAQTSLPGVPEYRGSLPAAPLVQGYVGGEEYGVGEGGGGVGIGPPLYEPEPFGRPTPESYGATAWGFGRRR